jgi:O-antigen biosynthesis protein
VMVSYFSGLYDKPFKQRNLNKSALIAMLVLLSIYGLMPQTVRYSRGIIFISGIVVFVLLTLLRFLLVKANLLESKKDQNEVKQTIAIGNNDQYEKIKLLYTKARMKNHLLGLVSLNEENGLAKYREFDQFKELVKFKHAVLATDVLGMKESIHWVEHNKDFRAKFFHCAASSIISSDDKKSIGESITQHGKFEIETAAAVRSKRVLDIAAGVLIIALSPILFFTTRYKKIFFSSLIKVLLGKMTLVGYIAPHSDFPTLKPSVLKHIDSPLSSATLQYELDFRYAKNYNVWNDLKIVTKAMLRL